MFGNGREGQRGMKQQIRRVLFWVVVAVAGVLVFDFSASRVLAASDPKMRKFVDELLAKMTLEEKVGQLVQYSADMSVTGATVKEDYKEEIKRGRVGSIFNAYTPKFTRELQQLAIENSRLKIPLIFAFDVIHGHRTAFPIPLGESASWDLKLMEETARTAAREAAADGIHWTFAPMVDIARDPRWGRVMEGAGEDPWLGAKIATARVHGFQGDDLASTESVLACAKHFAAYGAAQGGRDYNTADMSERELRETYLPPFQAAIDAGVRTLMPSFNEISGAPSTASEWLLGDLLRKQWKFDGVVVTDYTAINELIPHGVAVDERQAGMLAFRASVDMDMQGGVFARHLGDLVKKGEVGRAALDRAVRRVIEAKYVRGLFADPYRFSNEDRAQREHLKPANRALAREVARQSIVLLKNDGQKNDQKDGRQTLPLKRQGTIALVGPFGEDRANLNGGWAGASEPKNSVTLLEGLKAAVGDKAKILSVKGANFIEDPKLLRFLNNHTGPSDVLKVDQRSSEEMIKEALSVVAKADVVVVALGETIGMSGEGASRTEIRLPEPQRALLRALRGSGKPLVLVLFNGRPLVLEEETQIATAVLEAWYLGTESGNAIADILFGDFNPSGKLTISFPRSEGQIPIYYAQKSTGRPTDANESKYTSRYIDSANEPLFPFGFGLSYTRFRYTELNVEPKAISPQEKVRVTFKISNIGDRDGVEIAQLYLQDVVASVTRPVKQLRGFQRVALKAGESREINMELVADDLKFWDQKMRWSHEPGEFKVMVGGSSASLVQTSFRLLAKKDKP